MIDANIKLKNLYEMKELVAVKDCIISGGGAFFQGEMGELTLHALNEQKQPTWNADDMVFGINRLIEIAVGTEEYVFSCNDSGAKLIYFPSKTQNRKLIILASGGAYGACCNLAEAFPVAAELNRLGYSCFCLVYRTATAQSFESGLMPKPLDDLAAAYRFLEKNKDRFNIDITDYDICGFSAGGHLCAAWGTADIGYAKYGLPAPQKIVLVYPLVDLRNLTGPVGGYLLTGLFGKDFATETISLYSPLLNIDSNYSKTYIVQAENDSTVGVNGARAFFEQLKSKEIPVIAEFVSDGEHGFGLGSKTSAKGWVERALKF